MRKIEIYGKGGIGKSAIVSNISEAMGLVVMQYRLNPYVLPFIGFRGALHLVDLWLNAI